MVRKGKSSYYLFHTEAITKSFHSSTTYLAPSDSDLAAFLFTSPSLPISNQLVLGIWRKIFVGGDLYWGFSWTISLMIQIFPTRRAARNWITFDSTRKANIWSRFHLRYTTCPRWSVKHLNQDPGDCPTRPHSHQCLNMAFRTRGPNNVLTCFQLVLL